MSQPVPDSWAAAGAFVYRTDLADGGRCLSEFVRQAQRQIAERRVKLCFLHFLIGTRFAIEPLRDTYAETAGYALSKFGEEFVLAVRAIPAMGIAGWALFESVLHRDFSERSALSAVCGAAAEFLRRAKDAPAGEFAPVLESGWQLDLLARAIEPFHSAILYVKGVGGADEIARPLVRNFAQLAEQTIGVATAELLGKVLECDILYLQHCFDSPIIFGAMLELFVKIGEAHPQVVLASPEYFFPSLAFLFAREFDANAGDWGRIVDVTVAFHHALFAVAGGAWTGAFRGAVNFFGGNEEIVSAYQTAIAGEVDAVSVRASLNCLRLARDASLWG